MRLGGENRSTRSRQAEWKRGWEGEGHFSVTDCHTVYGLFMNKLCVSLGHCCGPVTMASMVRGRRNVALLGNRDAEGGRNGGGGVWRGASDYFNHWSHLHLSARGQPLSLSSSPHCALSLSPSLHDPSSHLCPSRFSPPIHRSGSLPLRLPLTVSPSLHPHLLTFISDLTPESLHGTFVYWQPVCVALRLYFLLAYHLLLSSADWMNPCF